MSTRPRTAAGLPTKPSNVPATTTLLTRPASSPMNRLASPETMAVRHSLRSHIRQDNDSIIKQWSRLREAIRIEDRTRDRFEKESELNARVQPPAVKRLISTLKSSVHRTMRDQGGTPFSIIRSMFLYWDREKSGKTNERVLTDCLRSLGVRISCEDIRTVLEHYSQGAAHSGGLEMNYVDLLRDVNRGEPTLTTFVDPSIEAKEESGRFALKEDEYKNRPQAVTDFIEAVHLAATLKMRKEGGTIFSHVRKAFLMADFDYTNALNEKEFTYAMRKGFGLNVPEDAARTIIKYYDRRGAGECDYPLLLKDITSSSPHMLDFVEESPRTVAKTLDRNKSNPFLPKPFVPKPKKAFEALMIKLLAALSARIVRRGGSVRSWLQEAFTSWDPMLTGRIRDWRSLQGALKAVGLLITQGEAECIIDCFARGGAAEFHYADLIDNVASQDASFLHPEKLEPYSATSRAPPDIERCIEVFRRKLLRYSNATHGAVNAKDVLYGTLLRFDGSHSGRIDFNELKAVALALKINLSDESLRQLVAWFDSNGSNTMEYHEFVKQIFGPDELILSHPITKNSSESQKRLAFNASISSLSGPSAMISSSSDNPVPNDSKLRREIRRAKKCKQMIAEKIKLQNRIDSIDLQCKALKTLQETHGAAHS